MNLKNVPSQRDRNSLLGFVEFMNEYDREGQLDHYYSLFDPLNRADWQRIFAEKGFIRYGFRHGPNAPVLFDAVIPSVRVLVGALSDQDFDWSSVICNFDESFQLPSCWQGFEIDGRLIFEESYRAVYECWREQIAEFGFDLPSLQSVSVPQL